MMILVTGTNREHMKDAKAEVTDDRENARKIIKKYDATLPLVLLDTLEKVSK